MHVHSCACRRQVFLDFAKALLNDLSYLMEDSFDRIADVQARLFLLYFTPEILCRQIDKMPCSLGFYF